VVVGESDPSQVSVCVDDRLFHHEGTKHTKKIYSVSRGVCSNADAK